MTEVVTLSDSEGQLLILLLLKAWVDIRDDPDLTLQAQECEALIRKLEGPDKVIMVQTVC